MLLEQAIDRYHSLMTDTIAEDADFEMRTKLRERSLYFGERPLCRVLRPHFYFQEQWAYLRQQSEIILRAFARAHAACMEQDDLRAQLSLEAYEEQLFSLDRGGVIPWTSSRLDSFFRPADSKLYFMEYNAETPAGMGYGDVLSEVFMELEPMRRFNEYYHTEPMPTLDRLRESLLRAYREWGGAEPKPQIAIMDWDDVPTLNEHAITMAYFKSHGLMTVMVDPRRVEYRAGALWSGDFRIDIIYKRVLISEMIHRLGIEHPIVQAVRDRAVMMTNSFSAKLMAKKASFAFLSDEQNAHLFTPEQVTAIHEHIPWTRLLQDRKTIYRGNPVDLLPFASRYRERLVIKPNDEYGGKGVVLGWETDQTAWDQAVQEALTTPHVVQERIMTITRDFPMWVDDRLDISPRYVDADPYVFYGERVQGCLTRLSSEALLNVTAGGGSVVPTFLLTPR